MEFYGSFESFFICLEVVAEMDSTRSPTPAGEVAASIEMLLMLKGAGDSLTLVCSWSAGF